MKNLFKKGAVAAAVAGSLMVSGVAGADSVLAPFVVGIDGGGAAAGMQTYLSIKARGNGTVNARMASSSLTDLHYVWFKKGSTIPSLYNLGAPCEVSNNNGRVSPWDMVFQRTVGNVAGTGTGNMNIWGVAPGTTTPLRDASQPNGYTAGDFVGFVVITDEANDNDNPAVKDLANEGELSGFGYVVDPSHSVVYDYKLLNNHRSKVEGDFSAGFISKKSVDFSWFPQGIALSTEWLTVVAGEDMLKADSGAGSYDATVYLSQDTASGSVSPQLPTGGSGVYNNDEKVTSGAKNLRVTCMGIIDKTNLLSTLQLSDTMNGGWKRMSIQNSTTRATDVGGNSDTNTTQTASGAIIYKAEALSFDTPPVTSELFIPTGSTLSAFGKPGAFSILANKAIAGNASDAESYNHPAPTGGRNVVLSFQPETSGHLSATPEPHPNRPY